MLTEAGPSSIARSRTTRRPPATRRPCPRCAETTTFFAARPSARAVSEASHAALHQRPKMPSSSALDTSAGIVAGGAVPLLAQADADGNLRSIVSLLPIALVVLAAYLLLFRPEREKLRRQQEMLGGLKKNDRVVTASGLYGTVANVDRESDRVTLKVDDAANVKVTVTLASIARVLGDRPAGDAASPSRDDA